MSRAARHVLALLPPALCACTTLARPGVGASAEWTRGTIRRDSLWSQALGTTKHFLVYLPPSYATQPHRRYPVAYYLHGMWGSENDWIEKGHLAAAADSLAHAGLPELIVVMPDGDNGWYTTWNSLGDYGRCRRTPPEGEPAETFCVPWPHYDDYIARDVVAAVDSGYRTLPTRTRRGAAGLSMGGYGAVTLALVYPDVFSAAASHSGVLAPLEFDAVAGGRDIASLRAGAGPLWPSMELAFGSDTSGWWARDPARLALRMRAMGRQLPALYLDVGTGDRFLDQNRILHEFLGREGIAHVYVEHPGGHSWEYWRAHLPETLAWLARRLAAPAAGTSGRDDWPTGAVTIEVLPMVLP